MIPEKFDTKIVNLVFDIFKAYIKVFSNFVNFFEFNISNTN